MNELYHHGVKGMKWGVRKKRDKYVSRFQSRRNASKAAKESREADIKNGVSSISTIQRHATLAKAKSRLADAEYNQKLRDIKKAEKELVKKERSEKAAVRNKKIAHGAKIAAKASLKLAKTTLKMATPIAKKGSKAATKLVVKMGKYSISAIKKMNAKRKRKRQLSEDAKAISKLKKKNPNQMSNAELRILNERTRLEREYKQLHPNAASKGLSYAAKTAAVMGTAITLYNNSNTIMRVGKSAGDRIVDTIGNMVVKDINKRMNR